MQRAEQGLSHLTNWNVTSLWTASFMTARNGSESWREKGFSDAVSIVGSLWVAADFVSQT